MYRKKSILEQEPLTVEHVRTVRNVGYTLSILQKPESHIVAGFKGSLQEIILHPVVMGDIH